MEFYDPSRIRVTSGDVGSLRLSLDGGAPIGAYFRRAFPDSMPDHCIEVRGDDGAALGMIESLSALDTVSRELVSGALSEERVQSVIEKVMLLREEQGNLLWHVSTDRGDTVFTVKDPLRNVQLLPPHRVRITDVDENQYEVPDYRTLDSASRELVMSVI